MSLHLWSLWICSWFFIIFSKVSEKLEERKFGSKNGMIIFPNLVIHKKSKRRSTKLNLVIHLKFKIKSKKLESRLTIFQTLMMTKTFPGWSLLTQKRKDLLWTSLIQLLSMRTKMTKSTFYLLIQYQMLILPELFSKLFRMLTWSNIKKITFSPQRNFYKKVGTSGQFCNCLIRLSMLGSMKILRFHLSSLVCKKLKCFIFMKR